MRVGIYDWKGKDREAPRAVIRPIYLDRDIPVKEIDIIKSVQNDPLAIRHFAIQIAISRWSGIIRYHKNYYRVIKKVTVKKDTQKHERGVSSSSTWYKIAADHLKRIGGQTILEEAERNALPREVALYIHAIDILQFQSEYLRLAWELIRKDAAKGTRLEYKVKALKKAMDACEDKMPPFYQAMVENSPAPQTSEQIFDEIETRERVPLSQLASPVFSFLESEQGSRYLNKDRPGQYRNMYSDFQSWLLNRDKTTLNKYLRKAKKVWNRVVAEDLLEREHLVQPYIHNHYILSRYFDLESPYTWISPSVVFTNTDQSNTD